MGTTNPLTSLDPNTYKIYCEDDYFLEESSKYYHPKCDLTLQEVPSPLPFNYGRFTAYLKLKSEVERRKRLVAKCQGKVPPDLDYYTDTKLKDELFGIYGAMDVKSEKFKRLFENYKIQRLEQLREWIRMESDVGEGETECFEEDLQQHFSEDEIKQFENLSVIDDTGHCREERFVLPRNTRKVNIKASKKGRQSHLKNLEAEGAAEASKLLQEYPLGLAISIFLDKLRENVDKKGYLSLTLNKDILTKSPWKEVIFIENYNNDLLVFPADIKPYICKMEHLLLWNIWHNLTIILSLSYGIIEVKESVHLLQKLFGINQFNLKNWGFESEVDFVTCLFTKWGRINMEVVQLEINGEKNYYLAKINKKGKKLIRDKLVRNVSEGVQQPISDKVNAGVQDNLPPTQPTPSHSTWNKKAKTGLSSNKPPLFSYDITANAINRKYVQFGDTIFRERDQIQPGSQMGCVVSLINSPTDIYLVRQVRWKELERLFVDLKNYWEKNPTELSPHPRFLQKNFLCMAKSEEGDVYRVVILGQPDPQHYQLHCFDYGDNLKVRLEQLRYLPKNFLHSLEAQAIHCSLYNVASPKRDPKTGNDMWNKEINDFTRDLILTDDMPLVQVLFKQRVQASGKWLVKISSKEGRDYGEEIMQFVNSKYKK